MQDRNHGNNGNNGQESSSRRNGGQQRVLAMYGAMYDDNLRQIENLQSMQRIIIGNITSIVADPRPRGPRGLRTMESNINNTNIHSSSNSLNSTYTNHSTNPSNNNHAQGRRVPTNSVRRTHSGIIPQSDYINRPAENVTYDTTIRFFDNVLIPATEAQISAATTIRQFSTIDNALNSSCPITLCGFTPTTMVMRIDQCGHIFSPDSLMEWFNQNVRCPVCRHDIRSSLNNQPSASRQSLGNIAGNFAGNIIETFLRNNSIDITNILDASGNDINISSIFGTI